MNDVFIRVETKSFKTAPVPLLQQMVLKHHADKEAIENQQDLGDNTDTSQEWDSCRSSCHKSRGGTRTANLSHLLIKCFFFFFWDNGLFTGSKLRSYTLAKGESEWNDSPHPPQRDGALIRLITAVEEDSIFLPSVEPLKWRRVHVHGGDTGANV